MILKLIPGQRINFTVSNTEEVQGNYGPQIKFTGQTPDDDNAVLFLNVDTATRQLARIGLDAQSVVGRQVEFARTEKNGTKYTDINKPSAMPQPSVKPLTTQGKEPYSSGPALPYEVEQETGAPPAVVTNKADGFQRLFSHYDVCMDHALQVAKKMETAGVGSDPEAVAAIAATLLIQADRQGLTR